MGIRTSRVIHVGSGHPADHIRVFQKECKSLESAGYDVGFIAVHDRSEIRDGIEIIPVRKPRKRFDRLVLWPWVVLAKALRQRAGTYHVHTSGVLALIPFLRLSGARVIYDMHENTPKALLSVLWLPKAIRPIASKVYSLLERAILAGVPVLFAEISYAKDYQWVRQAETVLNMPIADRLLDMENTKFDSPTIVYLGGVSESRGSMVTLEALRILKSRGKIVNWLCIGPVESVHQAAIAAKAQSYGIESQVQMVGYVSPEEGWNMVSKCHVGMAVLKPQPNYYESYPTKMFEYMALGLPVIVSGFPLYRYVVESASCGLCVDPDSPDDVADTVERLVCNPNEALRMGMSGRRAVQEEYNWDCERVKLLNFYKSLLSSNDS